MNGSQPNCTLIAGENCSKYIDYRTASYNSTVGRGDPGCIYTAPKAKTLESCTSIANCTLEPSKDCSLKSEVSNRGAMDCTYTKRKPFVKEIKEVKEQCTIASNCALQPGVDCSSKWCKYTKYRQASSSDIPCKIVQGQPPAGWRPRPIWNHSDLGKLVVLPYRLPITTTTTLRYINATGQHAVNGGGALTAQRSNVTIEQTAFVTNTAQVNNARLPSNAAAAALRSERAPATGI